MFFDASTQVARYGYRMIDRFLNWGNHGKPKSSKIKGLSSSQDNVSVFGQSKLVLSDLWQDPYTIQSHPLGTNFLRLCLHNFSHCSQEYRQTMKPRERRLANMLGKGWVCCVSDTITRCNAFFLVLFNNKQ